MKGERVIAYIDGFNLYFGLKEKGWRCYYWIDIHLLCQNLLRSPQHLIQVKYFTSRIKSPPDKKKRQSTFLEALKTTRGIIPWYGIYQTKPVPCEKCSHINNIPEEKMTDVQISSEMVSDAHLNKYDTALLMTGDRDLVPAIEKVRADFPKKRVVVDENSELILGVKIIDNDLIYELNLKNSLDQLNKHIIDQYDN